MLSKIRHYVDRPTLKSIYHAIFESHLYYSSLVWSQNSNSIKRLYILQKKALRIMYFQERNAHTGPLFKDLGILKLFDKVSLENCKLISKSLRKELPAVLNNCFTLSSNVHNHYTRLSNLGLLNVPSHNTKTYGRYSVSVNAIYIWNYLQNQFTDLIFSNLTTNKLKEILKNYFINRYL